MAKKTVSIPAIPATRGSTLAKCIENLYKDISSFCPKESTDIKDRTLWAILTALRGPDDSKVPDTMLKWYTTARLRAIVCPNEMNFCDINHSPLNTIQLEERADLLTMCSRHFAQHWYEAVAAIKKVYNIEI